MSRLLALVVALMACSSRDPSPVPVDPADTFEQPDLSGAETTEGDATEGDTDEDSASTPAGVCLGECRSDNDCAIGQICALDYIDWSPNESAQRVLWAPYRCSSNDNAVPFRWLPDPSLYFKNNLYPRCSSATGCPASQACTSFQGGRCIWPCQADSDCVDFSEIALGGWSAQTITCVDGLCSPCKPNETCDPLPDGTQMKCRGYVEERIGTCLGGCDTDLDCRALGKICVPPSTP